MAKVVGIDLALSNILSPTQGSAVRYLREKEKGYSVDLLFLQGDITVFPLLEQDDRYMRIGYSWDKTEKLEKGMHNIVKAVHALRTN